MKKIEFPLDQSQIYLMKTIVGDDSYAIDNYNLWVNSVNIENYIDGDSYGMISTLYKRLSSLGLNDKNMNTYLGIYKKSVYKNSIHFFNLQQIGKKLNSLEIPFAALKGASYTIKYHKDIGIRSMNDLDIVVNKEDMPKAVSVLNETGFNSTANFDVCANLDVRYSYEFNNENNFEIDLHWNDKENPSKLFHMNQTLPYSYKDVNLKLANAENSIILLFAHASMKTYSYNIRWIFDLYTILNNEEKIDWDYIISSIIDTKLSLVISIMLSAFNELSSVKAPEYVISKLAESGDIKISRKHAKRCFVKPRTILGKLGFYYYSERNKDRSLIYRLVTFPGYILKRSRFSSYRELLAAFVQKYIFKKNPRKTN